MFFSKANTWSTKSQSSDGLRVTLVKKRNLQSDHAVPKEPSVELAQQTWKNGPRWSIEDNKDPCRLVIKRRKPVECSSSGFESSVEPSLKVRRVASSKAKREPEASFMRVKNWCKEQTTASLSCYDQFMTSDLLSQPSPKRSGLENCLTAELFHLQPSPKDSGIDVSSPPRRLDEVHLTDVGSVSNATVSDVAVVVPVEADRKATSCGEATVQTKRNTKGKKQSGNKIECTAANKKNEPVWNFSGLTSLTHTSDLPLRSENQTTMPERARLLLRVPASVIRKDLIKPENKIRKKHKIVTSALAVSQNLTEGHTENKTVLGGGFRICRDSVSEDVTMNLSKGNSPARSKCQNPAVPRCAIESRTDSCVGSSKGRTSTDMEPNVTLRRSGRSNKYVINKDKTDKEICPNNKKLVQHKTLIAAETDRISSESAVTDQMVSVKSPSYQLICLDDDVKPQCNPRLDGRPNTLEQHQVFENRLVSRADKLELTVTEKAVETENRASIDVERTSDESKVCAEFPKKSDGNVAKANVEHQAVEPTRCKRNRKNRTHVAAGVETSCKDRNFEGLCKIDHVDPCTGKVFDEKIQSEMEMTLRTSNQRDEMGISGSPKRRLRCRTRAAAVEVEVSCKHQTQDLPMEMHQQDSKDDHDGLEARQKNASDSLGGTSHVVRVSFDVGRSYGDEEQFQVDKTVKAIDESHIADTAERDYSRRRKKPAAVDLKTSCKSKVKDCTAKKISKHRHTGADDGFLLRQTDQRSSVKTNSDLTKNSAHEISLRTPERLDEVHRSDVSCVDDAAVADVTVVAPSDAVHKAIDESQIADTVEHEYSRRRKKPAAVDLKTSCKSKVKDYTAKNISKHRHTGADEGFLLRQTDQSSSVETNSDLTKNSTHEISLRTPERLNEVHLRDVSCVDDAAVADVTMVAPSDAVHKTPSCGGTTTRTRRNVRFKHGNQPGLVKTSKEPVLEIAGCKRSVRDRDTGRSNDCVAPIGVEACFSNKKNDESGSHSIQKTKNQDHKSQIKECIVKVQLFSDTVKEMCSMKGLGIESDSCKTLSSLTATVNSDCKVLSSVLNNDLHRSTRSLNGRRRCSADDAVSDKPVKRTGSVTQVKKRNAGSRNSASRRSFDRLCHSKDLKTLGSVVLSEDDCVAGDIGVSASAEPGTECEVFECNKFDSDNPGLDLPFEMTRDVKDDLVDDLKTGPLINICQEQLLFKSSVLNHSTPLFDPSILSTKTMSETILDETDIVSNKTCSFANFESLLKTESHSEIQDSKLSLEQQTSETQSVLLHLEDSVLPSVSQLSPCGPKTLFPSQNDSNQKMPDTATKNYISEFAKFVRVREQTEAVICASDDAGEVNVLSDAQECFPVDVETQVHGTLLCSSDPLLTRFSEEQVKGVCKNTLSDSVDMSRTCVERIARPYSREESSVANNSLLTDRDEMESGESARGDLDRETVFMEGVDGSLETSDPKAAIVSDDGLCLSSRCSVSDGVLSANDFNLDCFVSINKELFSLQNKVAALLSTVFPCIWQSYDTREVSTLPQLLNRILDAVLYETEARPLECRCDCKITVCQRPTACLKLFQRRVLNLLKLLLPSVDLEGLELSQVESLVEAVTVVNSVEPSTEHGCDSCKPSSCSSSGSTFTKDETTGCAAGDSVSLMSVLGDVERR